MIMVTQWLSLADNCSVMDARRFYELSLSLLHTWKSALQQRSLASWLRIPLGILYETMEVLTWDEVWIKTGNIFSSEGWYYYRCLSNVR
jgi:hypothetical protein